MGLKLYGETLYMSDNVKTRIDRWVVRGKDVLPKDKWSLWEQIVHAMVCDGYNGMEFSICLDVVEILNAGGSLEDAKEAIESQDSSKETLGLIRSMVRFLAPRGEAFYGYLGQNRTWTQLA